MLCFYTVLTRSRDVAVSGLDSPVEDLFFFKKNKYQNFDAAINYSVLRSSHECLFLIGPVRYVEVWLRGFSAEHIRPQDGRH